MEILPHTVHDFLEVADHGQHGKHRLHQYAVLPRAALTQFQVAADIPTSTLDFFFFIRYIRCLTSIAVLALDGGGHHEVATAQTTQSLARPLPDPATGDGVARTRPHQRLTR